MPIEGELTPQSPVMNPRCRCSYGLRVRRTARRMDATWMLRASLGMCPGAPYAIAHQLPGWQTIDMPITGIPASGVKPPRAAAMRNGKIPWLGSADADRSVRGIERPTAVGWCHSRLRAGVRKSGIGGALEAAQTPERLLHQLCRTASPRYRLRKQGPVFQDGFQLKP